MFIEIRDDKDIQDLEAIVRLMLERGYTPYVELGIHRSKRQNRKFHALCRELADLTGHTPAEIKRWVKEKVFGDADISSRKLDHAAFSRMIDELEHYRDMLKTYGTGET